MEQIFETLEPIAAYVELGAGSLTILAEETEQTRVQISGPRAEEFSVELEGRELAVVGPRSKIFSGNDRHVVEVALPIDSDLATRTGSADTVTSGRLGLLRLKTGSGSIDVDTASGHAVIESGSGDVRCEQLAAEARIKSGSGDVEVGEVSGKLIISTGSGDITLGSVHETTVVKTGSGDLDILRSAGDVVLDTASGDLTLGHASQGSVSGKSASGDIRIAVPHGTPVWTDINTVSGRVASNLESAGEPAEGQPHLEIRATTVSGDVQLVQA